MRLWDWAVAAYGRPGVADACLHLQDTHGQNTCLLLFAAWARTSDHAVLSGAVTTTRMWDAATVVPLRQVRRSLKSALPPVEDAAREALRNRVKAAELDAERVLLDTLESLAPAPMSDISVRQALTAAAEAWGPPPPSDAVAALAQALE